MCSISEEPGDGKSEGSQLTTDKANVEHDISASQLLKGTETREKTKSDLMEELGLDDADDIEDASDWDSTSVSLKSTPSSKSFNVLVMKDQVSLLQLAKHGAIPETSETIPVEAEELSDAHVITASTGPQCSEQVIQKVESGEIEDKNVIDMPNTIEKPSPENQTVKAKVSFTCDKKKTDAAFVNEKSDSDHSQFDSALWEERYEKLWVANEKREVKTGFKNITAELKQMFGEINVSQKASNTLVEGTSQGGFTGVLESTNESPSPQPCKTTIGIQAKSDFGDLKTFIAEEEHSAENLVLCLQNSVSQKVHFKLSERDNQNAEQNWNANDEILSNSAESAKINRREEKSDNTLAQLETDVSRKTTISEKYPDYSPAHSCKDIVSGTIFKTMCIKRPIVIDNTNILFGITKDTAPEILPHFNHGVFRDSTVSTCKDKETKVGNKLKHCPQSCCQISKKELDEELERDVARFKNEVDEEKRKQKWEKSETPGKGDDADTEKELNVNPVEKRMEHMLTVNEKQPIQTEMVEDSQENITSSVERTGLIPVPPKGTNLSDSMDARKSENKRRISKQRASRQFTETLHHLQDESSLSEASLEEERNPAKTVNRKNKICRSSDMDDLTQSSDTATEDIELPKSVCREAVMLIDQLSLNSTDSVSLLKIQNVFHGYERLIEHERGRYAQVLGKVKKLENEKKEQQRMLEEMREMKRMVDHQKMERESDIGDLKFSLKQEEEKRMSAEILYEKNQEQLRKKEEQYCQQVEEKQQLELMLRTLEMELRTLKTHLKEVEDERNETQRLLSQEQNARALQEGILNTHFWRQKELEESKRKLSKSSEMSDGHDQEKELLQKNKILQDELSVLRLEHDQLMVQHQEEAVKYLEENETLKEKTEELKKELKMNEEALTQTVFQYNGQINVSKAESAMLTSKLELIKENKEQLEVELDSFRSRLNSALQELERNQISKTDLERTVQRERDDWLRLKDRLNHDMCNLREANNAMSQQLSKAESKANSLENELHHMTHTLREKNLLLDGVQRDLSQSQSQVRELENARQTDKDQMNKYVVKQDSLQERLAQLQSENLLLRQQFEDFQNKGIIKEKVVTDVQDRFNDMFSKLRADAEKQVEMMEERNKELITKCNHLREQVFQYETEKVEREGALRQLQQELADSLKKQSMSEASLEVTSRYRNDLEEDKQQLQKEVDRLKCKLQDLEEQYSQSERRTYDLRHALDAKEHETSVASQKLQDLLAASTGTNNTVKQLEEHMQRLEIENARLEATTKQQTGRIEILQKDLQNSAFVHSRLEELITGLQTAKINLEEQLSHQVQKQNMLSVTTQDTHNMWEEELKSRSKLGVRLTELDREKVELTSQLEYERKKVKKLIELKRSVEMRLDQEMKRNGELQKECSGIKKLLKTTKKKLKESESGNSSSPISLKREIKNRYSEIETEVGKLRTKVDELSRQLDTESTRRTQLESANCDLREQLSSMKLLHRNHEKLEKSKLQLEEEVADLRHHVHSNLTDHNQLEQYKRDIEERARQEIRQKLEEVNLFLQQQAVSQETLEQLRATNNTSLRNQLEHRIRDLETELARLKSNQQDNVFQKESTYMELERYKGLYAEELKRRKSLESKLDRANEKLAEANAKLLHERQRSSSLLANSFVSGSFSASPVLETVQLGNLGTNLALNRTLNFGGGYINPNRSTLSSKDSVEAYLAKMRVELEKTITKELEQATAELDAGSVRVSPVGSIDGSSRNPNMDQDQVSKAKQEYLDVLKKNYML
ncbi:ankyrin repeat domain-containing protein 26-like isoform X2 [Tiliqua scincoides]|uniref:ankyrin repeat domain-containing protein 26-like isoform X2 n=1 Tax=Tiliqua scincoides TaxID=71010 RepID=UPI003462CF1A